MSLSAMQTYYAARAREYERVYEKPERQDDLRAMEQWLPPFFQGRRVLEIACGTGYWTRLLAPVVTQLLGIDTSAETLAIASARISGEHLQLQQGDAYALPSTPGGFSGAFAGFWFSHIPAARVDGFLHGLHQRLVPGARVVFIDNLYVHGSSTPIIEQDSYGDTYQLRHLSDGSAHRVLKNFPSESALRGAVTAMASDVQFHTWKHFWALEYTLA